MGAGQSLRCTLRVSGVLLLTALALTSPAQTTPPARTTPPAPTEQQLRWAEKELELLGASQPVSANLRSYGVQGPSGPSVFYFPADPVLDRDSLPVAAR